jgi:hypothetical protein
VICDVSVSMYRSANSSAAVAIASGGMTSTMSTLPSWASV